MRYPNAMDNIKNEILLFMGNNNVTISKMAELSDLSEETIKYILHKKPKDCKVSTLIKLSQAMNISIDKMVGNKMQ